MEAGRNGNVATLRALHRAGCPWAPSPASLRRALYGSCFHGGQGWWAVLELVEREGGCRVDWGEVEEVARGARPGWLREDMGKGTRGGGRRSYGLVVGACRYSRRFCRRGIGVSGR